MFLKTWMNLWARKQEKVEKKMKKYCYLMIGRNNSTSQGSKEKWMERQIERDTKIKRQKIE